MDGDIFMALMQHRNAVKQAELDLYKFLLREFKPGTRIAFNHNGYRQTGVVTNVNSDALIVTNIKTRRTRRVGIYDVKGRIGAAGGGE